MVFLIFTGLGIEEGVGVVAIMSSAFRRPGFDRDPIPVKAPANY